MNLGMSASIIRMPFLSHFFFFLTKKVSIKREGQQNFFSEVLPFDISNHNNEQTN